MAITKIQSESLNLADDFAFTGTITGAGVTNKPAFFAEISSSTTITSATATKAPFNSEVYDTNSAFDTSNYRFTVPSGEGGKYHFTAHLRFYSDGNNGGYVETRYYKNGSTINNDATFQLTNNATDSIRVACIPMTITLDLSAGDYIEIYGQMSAGGTIYMLSKSFFQGYKLF